MPDGKPEPETPANGPVLEHVNTMVDSLIANVSAEDLRVIVRGMIATTSPSAAAAFTAAARARLAQVEVTAVPGQLFSRNAEGFGAPTAELERTLARVRALYGAGMGFASLRVLVGVVRATMGLRWGEGSAMEGLLASVDADICQGIQSSREEIDGGRIGDMDKARETADVLRTAVGESAWDVQRWGGEFPFERSAVSLDFWKL